MHNEFYVKTPPFRNCSVDLGSDWEVKTVTIYQKQLFHARATYCLRTTRTICTWAFFRISLQVTNDTTAVSSISARDCKLLKTSRSIWWMNEWFQWRTQNRVSYSYYFIGTHCIETTSYLMEYGEILFFDGSHPVTYFTRTAGRNPKAQKCLTCHETMIWDWSAYAKQCQYAPSGKYASYVSQKEVIINCLKADYVVKIPQLLRIAPSCNLSEPKLMGNDVVIAFEKQLTLREETFGDQPWTFLAEKITESKDPENTRFQFL